MKNNHEYNVGDLFTPLAYHEKYWVTGLGDNGTVYAQSDETKQYGKIIPFHTSEIRPWNDQDRAEAGTKLCPTGTQIQTLIFEKGAFDKTQATTWAHAHGFNAVVDEKENTYRFRQHAPNKFKQDSFRTINITKGVKAVIGCPDQAAGGAYWIAVQPTKLAEKGAKTPSGATITFDGNEASWTKEVNGSTIEITGTMHKYYAGFPDRYEEYEFEVGWFPDAETEIYWDKNWETISQEIENAYMPTAADHEPQTKPATEHKMPSHLEGRSIEECQQIAREIASETFVKFGNKAVPFTENNELRNALGGRYQSYPELAKAMIYAYNNMQADLILSNMRAARGAKTTKANNMRWEKDGSLETAMYKGCKITKFLNDDTVYMVNDENFYSLAQAIDYIDKGTPISQKTINAYRHGAMERGGMLAARGAKTIEDANGSKLYIGDIVEWQKSGENEKFIVMFDGKPYLMRIENSLEKDEHGFVTPQIIGSKKHYFDSDKAEDRFVKNGVVLKIHSFKDVLHPTAAHGGIARDRKYTSAQKHEEAYTPKRKSPVIRYKKKKIIRKK